MKYKLVIFDWQGTLTDPIAQFVSQFIRVAKSIGLPVVEEDELASRINLDLCTLVQTLFPTIENHKKLTFIEQFNHYRLHHGHDVCLFEGVKPLLETLHQQGVFIGIATAASLSTLKEELTFSEIGFLIDVVKTPDHTLCKPSPDMLNEIMSELGCVRESTVMIGDSRCDFEAAKNANIDFIGLHLREEKLISEINLSDNRSFNSISELSVFF